MRRFIRFFWGTIVRPGATFDALAAERTVRWAVMLACLPVLQVWGNMALHAALGLDWLGTLAIRRIQRIPTWAATLTMFVSFALSMVLVSTFVR